MKDRQIKASEDKFGLWGKENGQAPTEALFLPVCWFLLSYKLNVPCKHKNTVKQLVD